MPPKKRARAASPDPTTDSPPAKRQTRWKKAKVPDAGANADGDAAVLVDTNNTSPKKKKQQPRAKKAKATDVVDDDDGVQVLKDQPDFSLASPATEPPRPTGGIFNTEVPNEVNVGDAQIATNKRLRIPVDEHCPLASFHVYIDPHDGIIYDASLNQTNASNNNNKFYRVQLLANSNGGFRTWTRWGRVGDHGQSKVLGDGDLDTAMKSFEARFKDKSGLKWADRGQPPTRGKYVFLERSYEPEDDESQVKAGSSRGRRSSPAKCTLDPSVKSLMELIFNEDYFSAVMKDLNYDVEKLPLGRLGKATISRGFQALKDLAALLDDPTAATSANDPSTAEDIEGLSNLYYSMIPHAFGRNRPPVIRSEQMLKQEIQLLESLSELKDSDDIIKAQDEDGGLEQVHPLDFRFNSLGTAMTPLQTDSIEFAEVRQYLLNTRGRTHAFDYKVLDIFRIERQGEYDRFDKRQYPGVGSDRKLLWHGSRTTNYGGILSQGLRIAPPEAPVSGYMFDKGIYLADMSSKSANYCYSELSGDTGILMLCEAELGDPMQILQGADYDAAAKAKAQGMYSTWGQGMTGPKEWKDAGCVHPSLEGVMMPDTTEPPGSTNVENAYLEYNEYIAYDVAQVRLRYLLRVRM
ncbi:hypothetical protein B0A55_05551 [Friedmanniomyces simplex]|uniref:Poly [ADP-ribose] polymerase n=1 Tax=Friedmanniomyces simplex TaxID=329884 RepID=A0A4U0X842_9PEZI|nr:hypothetical protein B0A55_05551 [Friedmanniomyces simplex]